MLTKIGKTLTTKERNALPDSAFALPKKRKYPIHDLGHARAALSFVGKYGTPQEKNIVCRKVKQRYGIGNC